MLRRLLSVLLIFSLLCVEVPVIFADNIARAETEEMDEATDAAAASSQYITLQQGDRDGDDSIHIVRLQTKLIELGYLRDSADGIYGGNTKKAVAYFQRNHNLEETGVADIATQEKLFNGTNLVHFLETNDPQSISYRVQDKMNLWGFTANVPNGVVNATTGPSITAFKTYLEGYLKIYPTPSPEPIATPDPNSTGFGDAAIAIDVPIVKEDSETVTLDVLNFINGVYPFEVYTQTLASGSEGLEVKRLQRRLYHLKYLAVADGVFDANTERALLYFQKKNNLPQTAVADEDTQRLLYSEAAIPSEEFVSAYKIVVDVSDQRTRVYQWNGSDYGIVVKEMICSTGLPGNDTETPRGTFQMAGPTGTGEWYYFDAYTCYAKWASRIVGGILFHSVVYSKGKVLNKTSVRKLGRKASHGCIRLEVENSKWIYENCAPGTTCVIQE